MLIVSNIMSLDGYVAGPGGNPMALPMDARFDRYNAERLSAAGLADEIPLLVGAVVLGEGLPAFDARPDLALLSTQTWADSSNVLLRYAASSGPKPRLSASA